MIELHQLRGHTHSLAAAARGFVFVKAKFPYLTLRRSPDCPRSGVPPSLVTMRLVCLGSVTILAAAGALAQSATSTYIGDINGNRTEASSTVTERSPSTTATTERWQAINGRSVPLEQVSEKVLHDGPDGKVTERIVK